MLKKPKVSAVTPTYNLKKELLSCIESITKQDYSNLEIIVVDNASTDGTNEAVKKKFSQIKLVRNSKNLGVTGGRNAGIKKATGEYVFFFDHDMVAEPKMISELVKVARSDPKIGIVTPRIYYWENKKRIWAAGTGINLWTGKIVFRGGRDTGQYDKTEEVQVAPAAIFVKRKVLDKIGGFDNAYFAVYEDTDFSFRARKAGFKIVYAPKAICYHQIPLLDKKEELVRLLSRSYWIGRNRIIFMKRFGNNFLVFLLFLPVFVGYYTFLAFRYQNLRGLIDFFKGTLVGLFLVAKGKA